MAPLLLQEKVKIISRLKPGGALILAGILSTEFQTVQKAFEADGLQLGVTRVEREWQSGSFRLR
jgi:ribosomal protein L11 methylase PrmA